jgi:urea transport system permease protein
MPSRTPLIDRKGWIFLAVLAAFCLAVPVLNLAVPEGSGLHLPTYLVALFGKYLA